MTEPMAIGRLVTLDVIKTALAEVFPRLSDTELDAAVDHFLAELSKHGLMVQAKRHPDFNSEGIK